MMDKHAKIFVAGHNGLVGSAIVDNLRSKGYTQLLCRGSKELDLRDTAAVADFFDTERPEYVVLAAAKVGGIIANNTYRADFIYENLMIQNNVIHQSYLHGVKKLLFLGSTCIYPKNAPQPMSERVLLTDELEYTNEPYAIAKIAGLKMCESYNLQYGTNFIAVMPTNLYGPNDNFDLEKSHVLPALIRKIHLAKALSESNWPAIESDLHRNPIKGVSGADSHQAILAILSQYGVTQSADTSQTEVEIWGTGAPLREFLWSREMADACVYIMEKVDFKDLIDPSDPQIRNCHINIGTGKEITIQELVTLIAQEVGYRGHIRFNAAKPDGTMRKLTDPTKLHQLGWHHQIDIEQGVSMMYQWYREQLGQ